ncbi:hypothetical protein, partial [Vibrio owensii]
SLAIVLSWSKDLIAEPAFSSLLFLSRVQVNLDVSIERLEYFTREGQAITPRVRFILRFQVKSNQGKRQKQKDSGISARASNISQVGLKD